MIDFNKYLTKEQKEKIKLKKDDKLRRTIGTIYAEDERGNKFKKTIILSKDYKIISFGWPCEYYLNDLIKNLFNCIAMDKVTRLTIDMCGLNHKGYEVFIPIDKTMGILRKAMQLRDKLKNEDKE